MAEIDKKREKIRDWVAGEVTSDCWNCEEKGYGETENPRCTVDYKQSDKIITYLHSQGVVIKVDREMPRCMNFERYTALTKAGYVAAEPLIGGD